MLLRICLIPLFALSCIALFANDSTVSWKQWKKSWERREVNTARINVEKGKSLIRKIELLDVRSDTERVGVYTNNFHKPCEIVYDAPLGQLLNKICEDTAAETVLLVIRNFWINEVQYFEGKAKASQSVLNAALPSSKLICSIDAFLKKQDKFYALTQVDTVFTNKRSITNSINGFTTEALSLIQNNLEKAIISKGYLANKQTDKEYIIKVYSRRFKIHAITDSTLKKGIYYTWEQFKNNNPDEKKFSIKSNKNAPSSLFVTDENGNEVLTRNIFAVSDGKNIYKIHQSFAFPIYKSNNAFYWTGLEQYDLKTKGAPAGFASGGLFVAGLEPVGAIMKIRLTPYLLNLETGKEY